MHSPSDGKTTAPQGQMNDEDRALLKRYIARQAKMKTNRVNWESHWQQCMENIVPRKEDVITRRLEGDRRGAELFDTTAIMANQLLAGALHGMLTNPATRFFEMMTGDPILDERPAVKNWCQDTGERMFHVLNNTNFQTEIHEIYIDLGAIGTACMYIDEHDDRIVQFNARAMKEIFVEENNLGVIDIVHRLFMWKPRQIIMEFGEENVPQTIRDLHRAGNEDPMTIIQVVEPTGKENKDGKFAYSSCYFVQDSEIILSKGGYREFPFAIPRWTKTTGETYGRGPGMIMLADIKMVNAMMETTLKGAQKAVDPPLMVNDDSVIGRVRLTPGGLTVVRPFSDVPIRPLLTNSTSIDFGYKAVEDVRKRIRSGFYVDQLQLDQGPQMTATEVMQRTEEKLRLMGPILGRQHFEFLSPVLERVYAIMDRKGKIPPPPAELKGKHVGFRYSSLVARAQRISEGQNFLRAFQALEPIFQAVPASLDIVDTDKSARYVFDIYGVPHDNLQSESALKKLRDAKAKLAQQQHANDQQQHQADIVSKVVPPMADLQNKGQGAPQQ